MSQLTALEVVAHWSRAVQSASTDAGGKLASSRTLQMSVVACLTFISRTVPPTNVSDTVFITCQHFEVCERNPRREEGFSIPSYRGNIKESYST